MAADRPATRASCQADHYTAWAARVASYHEPMLRLVGFVLLVLVLTSLLGHLPIIGPFFRHTGFIGLWITAIGLSWLFAYYGNRLYMMQRGRAEIRALEAVDSPNNHGKIGTMLLGQGRARKALPHLEKAVEGEPELAEWHYRLGTALLLVGKGSEAIEALRRCVAIDDEHAYGQAQMRLAEACSAAGRHEQAIDALATFERNHGPGPESAYRSGVALKALGRRDEARARFAEVGRLADEAARYQRRQAGWWAVRARFANLV